MVATATGEPHSATVGGRPSKLVRTDTASGGDSKPSEIMGSSISQGEVPKGWWLPKAGTGRGCESASETGGGKPLPRTGEAASEGRGALLLAPRLLVAKRPPPAMRGESEGGGRGESARGGCG